MIFIVERCFRFMLQIYKLNFHKTPRNTEFKDEIGRKRECVRVRKREGEKKESTF